MGISTSLSFVMASGSSLVPTTNLTIGEGRGSTENSIPTNNFVIGDGKGSRPNSISGRKVFEREDSQDDAKVFQQGEEAEQKTIDAMAETILRNESEPEGPVPKQDEAVVIICSIS